MAGPLMSRRAVVGGGASILAGSARSARAQSTPIRIGVLTDQTGPYADSGGPGSVLAAEMAAAEARAASPGLAVEILHGDTQNKADVAATLARRWYDEGVDAIVDLPVTPVAAAVQQIAREKGRTVMITAAAATELTSKTCSPVSTHWADDTHALSTGAATPIVAAGGKDWFFITVDMAFGQALERESAAIIKAGGGRVLGSVRFPLGTTDFAASILQAQSSGAGVIGLASVGTELVNLIKQAGEFGLQRGGTPTLVGFLIYITEVHALGLQVAQGFTFPSGFYWNQNETARAWSRQFFSTRKAMPTRVQAGVYTATRHFLRAVTQSGSRDPLVVNQAMRQMPVDYLGRPAHFRPDGRLLYDVTVYRVRAPGAVSEPWDYYEAVTTLPAATAFAPAADGCG